MHLYMLQLFLSSGLERSEVLLISLSSCLPVYRRFLGFNLCDAFFYINLDSCSSSTDFVLLIVDFKTDLHEFWCCYLGFDRKRCSFTLEMATQ